MNKVDIVRQLYEKSNKKISMKDLDKIVEQIFAIITDELNKGEEVHIADFGSFALPEELIKPVVRIKKVKRIKK